MRRGQERRESVIYLGHVDRSVYKLIARQEDVHIVGLVLATQFTIPALHSLKHARGSS